MRLSSIRLLSEFQDSSTQSTQVNDCYLDPDVVMSQADPQTQTVFVFTADGRLFHLTGFRMIHSRMIKTDQFLKHKLYPGIKNPKIDDRFSPKLLGHHLFGRSGKWDSFLVSFWNSPKPTFDKLVGPCLTELLSHNLIPQTALVQYPTMFGVPVSEVLAGTAQHDLGDEQGAHERAELARQMHLMRGDEKKAAMKQLGVGGGGSANPHPVAKSLQRQGLLMPGQKWWAPHSEGKV